VHVHGVLYSPKGDTELVSAAGGGRGLGLRESKATAKQMCTAKQQGESDSPPRVTCAYRCNARLTVDACMELQILLLGPYHFPYIVYHTSYYNTSPLSWNHASHGHLSLSTFYHTLLSLLGTSLVAAACAFRAHRLVHRYYPCYKEHCKITSASLPSTFSFSVFPNFHVRASPAARRISDTQNVRGRPFASRGGRGNGRVSVCVWGWLQRGDAFWAQARIQKIEARINFCTKFTAAF
jgi:hypothetical protein